MRDRALKVALIVVGLLFIAGVYPVAAILWGRDQPGFTDAMMLSLYVTLGIFLLLAVRNPSAHRSLIAFTAWSSFAHAAVMVVMALEKPDDRELLWGSLALTVIGVVLIALAPAKERESGAPAAAKAV